LLYTTNRHIEKNGICGLISVLRRQILSGYCGY